MSSVKKFLTLSQGERFRGWPIVGEVKEGAKIPYFGKTIDYVLKTGNGEESYTSILRHFGWAVCFGVTTENQVITLCQWKPGVNQASWELPPGGIGKLDSKATPKEIEEKTIAAFLKETGFGRGKFKKLGRIGIETGKYRGAGADDHGLSAHLFLATGLELVQEAREPNPNEIIETVMVPIDEFPEVLSSGLFVEESAVACAYKALVELGLLCWSI